MGKYQSLIYYIIAMFVIMCGSIGIIFLFYAHNNLPNDEQFRTGFVLGILTISVFYYSISIIAELVKNILHHNKNKVIIQK